MKRVLLVVVWACGGLLLVLICVALLARDHVLRFAHSWRERSDGAELAAKLVTPHDVLEYIAQHPEQAAIATWELGREEEGLFVYADRRQPVASAMELLVFARYARALDAGEVRTQERVPLAEWERFWLPGADGGAHEAALHEARAHGRVDAGPSPRDDAASVDLRAIAHAMIRYGDHAATDFLIQRFGRDELEAQSEQLGIAAEDALTPYSGMWLSWLGSEHAAPPAELSARYRALGRGAYTTLTWELSTRLRHDDALARREQARFDEHGNSLSLREHAQLTAALAPRGTARAYATLMEQIATAALPGSERVRGELEWPLGSAPNRGELDLYAAKRGSVPGVLVSASYARPKGAEHVKVCAVFFQQLPLAVWLQLSQGLLPQRFEAELLQDESFFALAKQRLFTDDAVRGRDLEVPHHAIR